MEERRRVPAETFIEKVSDLSELVAILNVNMQSHSLTMQEIKDNQKEYSKLLIAVERNNMKIEESLNMHRTCNIKDVTVDVVDLKSKVGIIGKVVAVLGAGLVPIIYKLFAGG